MKRFKLISSIMVLGIAMFASATAMAQSSAKSLFDAVYPGNGVSCNVCHTGSPGVLTSYGAVYKGSGGSKGGTASAMIAIETLDSDGDGISNVLEIRSGTDPITTTALTGVISAGGAVMANGSAVSGISTTLVTDLYAETGVNLGAGLQILGDVYSNLTLGTAGSVTLTFAADSAYDLPSTTVYEVTGPGAANVLTPTSIAFGSVTVTTTSATPKLIVVSKIPPSVGGSSSSGSTGGCLVQTGSSAYPLLALLMMLAGIALFRRKGSVR